MGKVIIIEDNPVYCDYVGNLLTKSGVPSKKYYSLQAAKKALLNVDPDDIILSDLRFPDGDGIELLRQLRDSGHRNPFFIMTDYDEVPTAVRSMKSGATDYVSKRMLEDELLPVLHNLWRQQEQTIQKQDRIYEREIRTSPMSLWIAACLLLLLRHPYCSGTRKVHLQERTGASQDISWKQTAELCSLMKSAISRWRCSRCC